EDEFAVLHPGTEMPCAARHQDDGIARGAVLACQDVRDGLASQGARGRHQLIARHGRLQAAREHEQKAANEKSHVGPSLEEWLACKVSSRTADLPFIIRLPIPRRLQFEE